MYGQAEASHLVDSLIFMCSSDDLINTVCTRIVASPTCVAEKEQRLNVR